MDVELFDTTLRDGTQGGELSLTLDQKLAIARLSQRFAPGMLQEISYAAGDINPEALYSTLRDKGRGLDDVMVAFGSTHKPSCKASQCDNLQNMVKTGAKTMTIYGKTWLPHVHGLCSDERDYLKNIGDSVRFLRQTCNRVIYDAEHFFSGFRDNKEYALKSLEAAVDAGADTVVLCDTKGMLEPMDLPDVIEQLKPFMERHPEARLGFHGHNDCGCADANTLTFVRLLADVHDKVQVQGTVNRYGERCGNAVLSTVVPKLIQGGFDLDVDRSFLTKYAHDVAVIAGVPLDAKAPYVGEFAFADKGGIHIFCQERGMGYNHADPEEWGNQRIALLTSMSGADMYKKVLERYGYKYSKRSKELSAFKNELRRMEENGYRIHASPAEHLLLVHRLCAADDYRMDIEKWRTQSELVNFADAHYRGSETTLVGNVSDGAELRPFEEMSTTSKGPVDSQYKVTQKVMSKQFPFLEDVLLADFKVGITRFQGSESAVLSQISFSNNGHFWTTQGVSENILEATFEAILKGFKYYVLANENPRYSEIKRPQ